MNQKVKRALKKAFFFVEYLATTVSGDREAQENLREWYWSQKENQVPVAVPLYKGQKAKATAAVRT